MKNQWDGTILGTLLRSFFLFNVVFLLLGCATSAPLKQPEVNSLVNAQRPQKAVEVMTADEESYGDQNVLLYWLDRGMAFHLAGDYRQSINAFAQAQQTFDQLYTESLSKKFGTLLLNDYFQDYRGEDYEYVLVNFFQALNYALLGDVNESLVEARMMDQRLRVLKQLYAGKNYVYQDDAFVRLVMGMLFESAGGSLNLNDAYIAYQKAEKAYIDFHLKYYGLPIPDILKKNLLALSQQFSSDDFERYRKKWPDIHFISLDSRREKGSVVFIELAGYSPVKVPSSLLIPVEKDVVIPVSIARLYERYSENHRAVMTLKKGGKTFTQPLWVGQRIDALGQQIYKQKRVWLTTKSIVRPIAKYLIQREARRQVEKKEGETAGQIVNILINAYNIYSEQTDLRSWQTLPNEIRLGHLWLDPGQYEVMIDIYDDHDNHIEQKSLGDLMLTAGKTTWIVSRSYP